VSGSPRIAFAALSTVAAIGTVSACDSTPVETPIAPPCAEAVVPGAPFGTRCGQLVDAQGRVVILRGINARVEGIFDVTFDDGRTALEPIPKMDATDFDAMKAWGFDALRLPIDWSALEPTESGGFDEAYLDRVEAVVDLAEAAGVVVLVDLHEDAYSKEIGEDGAPLWAIRPPPPMLLEGPLTDLGERRLSAPVLAAFETFFGPSADGAYLRERFAAAAEHVAKRLAHHGAVMGFEIFNEPLCDDAGIARLNDAAYPRVHAAAPDKLYLFEPPATRNLIDTASIGVGSVGPLSVYAPHVYTYAFADGAGTIALTKDDLARSNLRARDEASGWQAPLVITEWGFDPKLPNAADYFRFEQEAQDAAMASAFFWVWKEMSQGAWGCFDHDEASGAFVERDATRAALAHPHPARIAGFPRAFSYDRDRRRFAMTFYADAAVKGAHEIVVPEAIGALTATCDGALAPAVRDGTRVSVECGGADGRDHELVLE
jgi:endoglycosylceramidase